MFFFKWDASPARIIALGFALVIFLGSLLFSSPFCLREGVHLSYIDSLYMATSAVCVTGLVTVDPGSTFSPFGELILALLIQIGGLGVAAVGTGVIVVLGEKLNFKGRSLIKNSFNLNSLGGMIRFLRSLFVATFIIESIGAALSFPVFIQQYTWWDALGISCFHSIAAFNNSGFDILGTGESLAAYTHHIWLNVVTISLIFLGGIGFLVIYEVWNEKWFWRTWSLNTCTSIFMGTTILIIGAILLKFTESFSWLNAFFYSMSARTAGFATIPLSSFAPVTMMTMLILMFIGAAPGSTGGGIKTTTLFVLLMRIRKAVTNKPEEMFHYSIPNSAFRKASIVFFMGLFVVYVSTYLVLMTNPHIPFLDALTEMTSAYATVGLSTGITSSLNSIGKLISIAVMYIGRLGPITIATLWYYEDDSQARYPSDYISIG